MNVCVRPLEEGDDLTAVSRIYAESWRAAYRGIVPQSYLDRLADGAWAGRRWPQGYDLVLTLDGHLAGTSCISPARDPRWLGWGEVISLYLLPEAQGRGLGEALLKGALERLAAMGFQNVYLWVLEDNGPARRFYERQGLACSGERTSCVIEGRELWEVRYVTRISGGERSPL